MTTRMFAALAFTSALLLSLPGTARAQATHDHQTATAPEQAAPQTPPTHDQGAPAADAGKGPMSMGCCGDMAKGRAQSATPKADDPAAAGTHDHGAPAADAANGTPATDAAKAAPAKDCCGAMAMAHGSSQPAAAADPAEHACCCSGMKM